MRRYAKYLILAVGMAACDSATEAVGPETAEQPSALGAARSLVDPSTLVPGPPPGAVCWAVGAGTICHTQVSFPSVNEPVLDLACGTVYQTGTDVRLGIRWYDDENKLVKRLFTLTADASWSLSPQGAEPTVDVTIRENWSSLFAVPGDLSTEFGGHTAGVGVKVQSPGFGVIALVAGLVDASETFHGIFIVPEDPAVSAKLCAALTS
jgi:hypothetical protein